MSANPNNINSDVKLLTVSFIVLILDQVTKYLTKSYMDLRQTISVIGDTFRLTYIENAGMAFGIAIENKILFNLFSIAAAAAILWYFFKLRNDHFSTRFALAVIFGGAIGNLFDRIFHGSVIDFFDLNIPNIPSFDLILFSTPRMDRWPIFNVADIAVTAGMILLIFTLFSSKNLLHDLDSAAEPAAAENSSLV